MRRLPLALTASLTLLAAAAPHAQSAPLSAVASCDQVRVDRATGVARSLAGCGRVDASGGPVAAARRALGELGPALGLGAAGAGDLRLLRVSRSPLGETVRFRQLAGGVPVRDAQVAVVLGAGGAVRAVASGARADVEPDVATPAIGRERALEIARLRVGAGRLRSQGAELVVAPRGASAERLAWDVRVATADPAHDWRVLVAATDGEVLEVADELRTVDGTGAIYEPNPVQATGDLSLRDADDADQDALTNARVTTTLFDLDPSVTTLRGAYVDMTAPGVGGCDLPYVPGSANEPSRNYSYTRSDDRFEEANIYAAITNTARLYQALGFTTLMNTPLPVNAHCIADDQSFFSDGSLSFGDGGVDDGEDADIIVHEFGHGTQEDLVPGFGPGENTEQRAIGEGFGDVLAAMVYIDKGNPAYQGAGDVAGRFCVGEWDQVPNCLRRVDGIDEATGAPIGNYSGRPRQEHDDGRYWSAAMTCVFRGFENRGASPVDARNGLLRLVLAHHELLVPTRLSDGFEASVLALLEVDRRLNGGANAALIQDCTFRRLNVSPSARVRAGRARVTSSGGLQVPVTIDRTSRVQASARLRGGIRMRSRSARAISGRRQNVTLAASRSRRRQAAAVLARSRTVLVRFTVEAFGQRTTVSRRVRVGR